MKKTLTVTALLAGGMVAYAQGTISMNDYNGSFAIQVFTAQSFGASTTPESYNGYTATEEMGNTDNGNVVAGGTQTYNNAPLGAGYSLELLAAPGLGDALSTLVPTGPVITTWYSGSALSGLGGFWNSTALATVAGTTTTATVALAAWDNEGGTVGSLAAAQAAGDPWGVSDPGNVSALGYGLQTPPNLPATITSFSLNATPEPSTVALGVIGASTLLMRLRRKK